MLGLIATFSAGAGGGRELTDYEDYNGDGFPDIRNWFEHRVHRPGGWQCRRERRGREPVRSVIGARRRHQRLVGLGVVDDTHRNNDGGGMGSNVEPTSTKSSRA